MVDAFFAFAFATVNFIIVFAAKTYILIYLICLIQYPPNMFVKTRPSPFFLMGLRGPLGAFF